MSRLLITAMAAAVLNQKWPSEGVSVRDDATLQEPLPAPTEPETRQVRRARERREAKLRKRPSPPVRVVATRPG